GQGSVARAAPLRAGASRALRVAGTARSLAHRRIWRICSTIVRDSGRWPPSPPGDRARSPAGRPRPPSASRSPRPARSPTPCSARSSGRVRGRELPRIDVVTPGGPGGPTAGGAILRARRRSGGRPRGPGGKQAHRARHRGHDPRDRGRRQAPRREVPPAPRHRTGGIGPGRVVGGCIARLTVVAGRRASHPTRDDGRPGGIDPAVLPAGLTDAELRIAVGLAVLDRLAEDRVTLQAVDSPGHRRSLPSPVLGSLEGEQRQCRSPPLEDRALGCDASAEWWWWWPPRHRPHAPQPGRPPRRRHGDPRALCEGRSWRDPAGRLEPGPGPSTPRGNGGGAGRPPSVGGQVGGEGGPLLGRERRLVLLAGPGHTQGLWDRAAGRELQVLDGGEAV